MEKLKFVKLTVTVVALCVVLFLARTYIVYAAYREPCKVKYENEDGESKGYEVECTYMSGDELNKETESFNYDMFKTYAVVFWGEGKASVIKLKEFLTCGLQAEKGCAKYFLSKVHGADQKGREWTIFQPDISYAD